MCCSNGQVVPKNKLTNAANMLSLQYMFVCVAVMVRLNQEVYTKREWIKDREEMEVKISQ